MLTAREHGNVHRSAEFGAAALLRLLERCDALRRPDRFAELLLACECDARGRLGLEERRYPPRERLGEALAPGAGGRRDARSPRPPSRAALSGPAIGEAIRDARIEALKGLAPDSPSREVADRHPDQPDQHAAAERQEPLAAEQAEAEVARQAAEAVLLEPRADRGEDDQREEDDEEPADHGRAREGPRALAGFGR